MRCKLLIDIVGQIPDLPASRLERLLPQAAKGQMELLDTPCGAGKGSEERAVRLCSDAQIASAYALRDSRVGTDYG